MPARLPRLIDCSAQCIVKLDVRGWRVHAGDEDGQVERRRRPRLRVRVDDADEEVDREERAEEHRLRGDEEEHPEHGRARRASSGSRSAGRDGPRRARLIRAPRRRRCSARRPRARPAAFARSRAARPGRGAASASALLREGGDEDLVDALVANGVHRRRERVRVRHLAVRLDPLAAELAPAPAAGAAPPRGASPAPGRSAGR